MCQLRLLTQHPRVRLTPDLSLPFWPQLSLPLARRRGSGLTFTNLPFCFRRGPESPGIGPKRGVSTEEETLAQ